MDPAQGQRARTHRCVRVLRGREDDVETRLLTRAFVDSDTHGIVRRPGNLISLSSGDLGWTSLHVSEQREQPFSASVAAADDHLIVMHLGGPVIVSGASQGHQQRTKVGPGGIFLWPAGSPFDIRLEAPVDTLHLYLRRHIVEDVADSFGLSGPAGQFEPLLGGRDTLIEQLALEVLGAARSGGQAAGMYADHLALAIAGRLIRTRTAGMPPAPRRPGLASSKIQKVVDYVDAMLEHHLKLSDISAVAGLSRTHLSRQFKAVTGVSPHQYVLQRRVERAKRLLVATNEPIAQIAHACGFSHQEHMSGVFRRITGETPARYRQLTRQ